MFKKITDNVQLQEYTIHALVERQTRITHNTVEEPVRWSATL